MQTNASLFTGDFSSLDTTAGDGVKLLPGNASEPAATFSRELRVRSGEFQSVSIDAKADGGQLPADGNGLPQRLSAIIEELGALRAELDAVIEGGESSELVDIEALELSLEPLTLPPGMQLLPPADDGRELVQDIGTLTTGAPLAPGWIEALPAASGLAAGVSGKASGTQTASLPINEVARLTQLSVGQLEHALGRQARELNAADLEEIATQLGAMRDALAGGDASRGVAILPAALARVDGQPIDSGRDRLRPVGVGMPMPVATPVDVDALAEQTSMSRAAARSEIAGIMAAAQQDGLSLGKPTGQEQVIHAPGGAVSAGQSGTTVTPASAQLLTGTIDTGVNEPEWGDKLNERVVMMANNRLQNAELRLSPAELGPLKIRLSIEDNAANVSFVATNATTREAIEAALPRLRQMLEEGGIDLGDASVGEQSAEQSDAEARERTAAAGDDIAADADGRNEEPTRRGMSAGAVRLSRGLLDTFV